LSPINDKGTAIGSVVKHGRIHIVRSPNKGIGSAHVNVLTGEVVEIKRQGRVATVARGFHDKVAVSSAVRVLVDKRCHPSGKVSRRFGTDILLDNGTGAQIQAARGDNRAASGHDDVPSKHASRCRTSQANGQVAKDPVERQSTNDIVVVQRVLKERAIPAIQDDGLGKRIAVQIQAIVLDKARGKIGAPTIVTRIL
jgi:hypothetical protein